MKSDNQIFFTKKDGLKLKKDIVSEMDVKLDKKFDRRFMEAEIRLDATIAELKQELSDEQTQFLSDIHSLIDGLAIEVTKNREFRAITTDQVKGIEDRTGKLEKKVFGSVSAF